MRFPAFVVFGLLLGCGDDAMPPVDASLADMALPEADAGIDGGPACAVGSLLEGVPLPSLDDEDEWSCALQGFEAPARITCLGENDHGVAESWAVHGLLTAHFAATSGLDAVVLETGGSVGDRFDDFVRTGDEDALQAGMSALRGTLGGSTALEAFIRRLRDLAEASGEPLHVIGMDIAIRPAIAIADLQGFLETAELTVTDSELCLDDRPDDRLTAAEACDAIVSAIESDRSGLEEQVGALETERGLRNARNMAAGQRFLFHYEDDDFSAGSAVREPAMVANLLDVVGDENRAVVIGHNEHCGRGALVGRDPVTGEEVLSLGTFIDEAYPDEFAVIGQLYRAGERTDFRTGRTAPYPDTAFLLEGSFDPLTDAPAFLVSTESTRIDFTVVARTGWTTAFVPVERLDAIVWIHQVTATELR